MGLLLAIKNDAADPIPPYLPNRFENEFGWCEARSNYKYDSIAQRRYQLRIGKA